MGNYFLTAKKCCSTCLRLLHGSFAEIICLLFLSVVTVFWVMQNRMSVHYIKNIHAQWEDVLCNYNIFKIFCLDYVFMFEKLDNHAFFAFGI